MSKSKEKIEGSMENRICSAIGVDLKKIFEP